MLKNLEWRPMASPCFAGPTHVVLRTFSNLFNLSWRTSGCFGYPTLIMGSLQTSIDHNERENTVARGPKLGDHGRGVSTWSPISDWSLPIPVQPCNMFFVLGSSHANFGCFAMTCPRICKYHLPKKYGSNQNQPCPRLCCSTF